MVTKKHDKEALTKHLGDLIDICEKHSSDQKPDRDKALEYFNGEMSDLTAGEGRSQAVTNDVKAVIKKAMPSILRAILSNDTIAEYQPAGPEGEEIAAQATDYINLVTVPECGAEDALRAVIEDAAKLKTGILHWGAFKKQEVQIYSYSGQPLETAFLGLDGPDIEIFDQDEYPDPETGEALVDFKLRRIENKVDIRLDAVPRESFLIHPRAKTIDDSPIVGERQIITRSVLVSRGYDRHEVDEIPAYDGQNDDDRRDDNTDIDRDTAIQEMQEVVVYEVYVKLDMDDDGIAEIHKICLAENAGDDGEADSTYKILEMEEVYEVPYSEVVLEPRAYEFGGRSIAEDVMPIQRIKTALLRNTLDNVYSQNAAQPAIDPSKLTESGFEAVTNPVFGKPITLKNGASVQDAVQWNVTPFVADKSFSMLSYFDDEIRDRTGITDQSGGIDPEAFQQMTATSAQLMADSGIAQAEMIIRTLARGGIRTAFRGLLKLVIAHADKSRTVRLRNKWVEVNPQTWNADMDCTVNIGLGAGSKERDLKVLQIILGLQREIMTQLGVNNPFVKPKQLYNVLARITEAAGFPGAAPYFTEPTPEDIAALQQQGPSETEIKLHAQTQVEQAKAQARSQVEQAQMQADLQVKEAEFEKESQLEIMKAESTRELAIMNAELDLLKSREKLQFEREKNGLAPGPMGVVHGGDYYEAAE